METATLYNFKFNDSTPSQPIMYFRFPSTNVETLTNKPIKTITQRLNLKYRNKFETPIHPVEPLNETVSNNTRTGIQKKGIIPTIEYSGTHASKTGTNKPKMNIIPSALKFDLSGLICGRNFYLSYGHPVTDRRQDYSTLDQYICGTPVGTYVTRKFKDISGNNLSVGPSRKITVGGSTPIVKRSYTKMKLRRHQTDHFKRMCEILQTHPVAFDYSKPGRGKTIIAGAISSYYHMPMLIVCPAIAEEKVWTAEAWKYGWNIIDIISFDRLRGQYGKDCRHIYFDRNAEGVFTATDKLRRLLDSGVLIVIDEVSKLKNPKTGMKQVVHHLIREIVRSCNRLYSDMSGTDVPNSSTINSNLTDERQKSTAGEFSSTQHKNKAVSSRAVLLSAMPCDKPYHFSCLCQILGLTMHENMYRHNNSTKMYELMGYKDIVNWCSHMNPKNTDLVLNNYSLVNKRSIPEIIMRLYDKVIRDVLSSCMPSDFIPSNCIKNGFYAVSPEDVKILNNLQTELIKNVDNKVSNDPKFPIIQSDSSSTVDHPVINKTNNRVGTRIIAILTNKGTNWSQVTKTLKLLGKAKLRRLYMLIKNDLINHPHRKVIVGVWYVDHILWLMKAFKEYGAKMIYGDVNKDDRNMIIELFQQPNDICRVLIINPTVVGMCVPLDDQYGGYPRSEYILPDYRIAEIVQTTGRVLRETTKFPEETKIRMVYAFQLKEELKIVTTSVNKSINAKRAIAGNSGLLLPDDYDIEYISEYKAPNYPLPNITMISDLNDPNQVYRIWD